MVHSKDGPFKATQQDWQDLIDLASQGCLGRTRLVDDEGVTCALGDMVKPLGFFENHPISQEFAFWYTDDAIVALMERYGGTYSQWWLLSIINDENFELEPRREAVVAKLREYASIPI
jgi:hypothetical protein